MKIYPALKGEMGVGQPPYYVVMMTVRDLVSVVDVAQDILIEKAISDDLQRELKKGRTKGIAQFLERNDRFISSIVVAAIGGQPEFHSVEVKKENAVLSFGGLNKSFGALTFDGGEKYYALDGQHRLFALKQMARQEDHDYGVADDQVPVILITGDGSLEMSEANKRRYRRLFTWMNRYAKPTTREVNIIMDEDDLFSIVTRRLIEENPQFQTDERKLPTSSAKEISIRYPKVNVRSNSIKSNSSYFTTIRTLCDFTTLCLKNSDIDIPEDAEHARPSDEFIDNCFTLSNNIWDSLRQTVKCLIEEPDTMRSETDLGNNNMLFRPLGQLVFARSICHLFSSTEQQIDHNTTLAELNQVLAPLSCIDWELKHRPWLHLLTTSIEDENGNVKYRMRDEARKPAMEVAYRICKSMLDPHEKYAFVKTLWNMEFPKYFDDEVIDQEWDKVKQTITATRNKINKITA